MIRPIYDMENTNENDEKDFAPILWTKIKKLND